MMSMGLMQGSQKMSLTAAAVLFYKETHPINKITSIFIKNTGVFLVYEWRKNLLQLELVLKAKWEIPLYKWAFPQGSGARATESETSSPVKHEFGVLM